MGNRMEFYAGDARALVAAFEADRAADLRTVAGVCGQVDFSLHLDPDNMDELLAAACEAAAIDRLGWWDDALKNPCGGDEDASWLAAVDSNVVNVFAALDLATFLPKARPWLGTTLTPDFERATGALIELCKVAVRGGAGVVFTWSA